MRTWACVVLCGAVACSSGGGGRNRTTGTSGGTTAGTNGATNGTSGGTNGGMPGMPVDQTVIVPGAPADAPSRFNGPADPTLAPTLIYPFDGTMLPPNTNVLEFQFQPAAGTTLYALELTAPLLSLKIYFNCAPIGTGCGYAPDQATWDLIAGAARGDTVEIKLAGTGASGSVGVAATAKLSFTDEDLAGGLYYWAASSGIINRYDFGLRGQTAEQFYTPVMGNAICVGCHTLSRNGARIAVGLNQPTPAGLRVLDVATRQTLYESQSSLFGGSGGSNFEAFSPDGASILTSEGGNLVLHDAATGNPLGTTIMNANMPDWSADGSWVVFARGASMACPFGLCAGNPGVDGASLYKISVNGTAFGTEQLLVQGSTSANSYYPSFSPDGAWVAFNQSGTNSFDASDARVMMTPFAGGGAIDLAGVNTHLGNSWPKFAPFVHHFQGKTIYWLTFSSRRDYGLRLTGGQTAQVWMVAVSPDRLMTAGDGGYAPFWLPFQDLSTGNHIAQWVEKVDRMGCSDDSQCIKGEFCIGMECRPPVM